ncbi:MAG: putative CAAX amino terminal protease family protein [Promethearchaeota archaeon]|nr:MAG: putative CAAX amino terminal protease family protein [Candidatus Lokiarchaeota archaeon]
MADLSLAFNPGFGFPMIILMFVNNLITSGLEEPGWRGFAVSELTKKFTAYQASIIVYIIWAIWH